MQLGFVTAILPDLKLEEVLIDACEIGFDSVEVMCWPVSKADRKYAGVTHIDVAGFSQAAADDVKALCQEHNVGISGLGYYPNILCPNLEDSQRYIDHLRKVIDAAPLLGLDRVNTFIGADPSRPLEQNLTRFREIWPDIIRFAEDRGVRVGIENCPMLFSGDEWPSGTNLAYSPDTWRKMFDAIPSPNFGLNYDPSHMILQMMDYVAPIYEFKDRIFHVHAKDMKIDRRKLNDHGVLSLGYSVGWCVPKIPGFGDVDWQKFVSALTDIGYDGPLAVEVEDEAFVDSLEDRKRSLRISHDFLRPIVQ